MPYKDPTVRREYHQKWSKQYRKTPKKQAYLALTRDSRGDAMRALMMYLKAQPCGDCGQKFP